MRLGKGNRVWSYLLESSPQSYTLEFFLWSQCKLHCARPRPRLLLSCTSLLPLHLGMFFQETQEKRSWHSHMQEVQDYTLPLICLTSRQRVICLKLIQEEFWFGGYKFLSNFFFCPSVTKHCHQDSENNDKPTRNCLDPPERICFPCTKVRNPRGYPGYVEMGIYLLMGTVRSPVLSPPAASSSREGAGLGFGTLGSSAGTSL